MINKSRIKDTIQTKPFIGKRILAVIIDYSIIGIFSIAYIIAFGEPNNIGGYSVHGIKAIGPILWWALITIGTEQLFGATIGNQLLGLKPFSVNGINKELSVGQSVKRHLVDIVDMSFIGLVGIILIQKTEKNQRLGDLWAETVVIQSNEDKE